MRLGVSLDSDDLVFIRPDESPVNPSAVTLAFRRIMKRAGLRDSLDRIEQLRAFHRLTRSFPVWPYDLRNIRRFVTIILAPLLSTAAGAAIERLVEVVSNRLPT